MLCFYGVPLFFMKVFHFKLILLGLIQPLPQDLEMTAPLSSYPILSLPARRVAYTP